MSSPTATRISRQPKLAALTIAVLAMALVAPPAAAITLIDKWVRAAEIQVESWTGELTEDEEEVAFINLINERRAQLKLPPLPVPELMGQVNINDAPVTHLSFAPQSVSLTFSTLDIITEAPVLTNPLGIASVLYEASTNIEPGPLTWFTVGVGTDFASEFLAVWDMPMVWEPMIRGTPLDEFGAPINLLASTGDNALIGTAFSTMQRVPEPPIVLLIGIGVAGLGAFGRRFRMGG